LKQNNLLDNYYKIDTDDYVPTHVDEQQLFKKIKENIRDRYQTIRMLRESLNNNIKDIKLFEQSLVQDIYNISF
jgi:hypothetical protein